MSHSRERKEKICLNCNSALYGRYCQSCGQENIEPKESFTGLVTPFFNDITHFDGKFFTTLKYVLFRPGFLSLEYVKGRRARHLHPIRMYVFTSALFFIIFFAGTNSGLKNITSNIARGTEAEINKNLGKESKKDTIESKVRDTDLTTREAYDSAQRALPSQQRDGWLKRKAVYKEIEIKEKMTKDPEGILYAWLTKFIHLFPQLLFVSLPIFALILKLLYRRQKQFYYADHGIFSIHLYIFTFIAMLIYYLFTKLYDILHWRLLNYMLIGFGLYMAFYTYLAMRKFYQQGRLKTLVKYFLLSIMSFIVLIILFASFFMLSIFQI